MRQRDLEALIPKIIGEDTLPSLVNALRTLEVLSEYKYDEYQQFAPGHHFMDSLVQWLARIPEEHHKAALRLVFEKLIFFSRADIFHFTKMAFPYKVRPQILEWEALRQELPMHEWVSFSRSESFHLATRKTLFLGLSDGAHLDDFRRLGGLHNDQVHTSYHLPVRRAKEMIDELGKHIEKKRATLVAEEYEISLDAIFERIVLVDDFTASGISYIRRDEETKKWKGKIVKFLEMVDEVHEELRPDGIKLLNEANLKGILLIYVATKHAREHILSSLQELNAKRQQDGKPVLELEFIAVQELTEEVALTPENSGDLRELIENYDVTGTYDSSMKKGGEDGHQKWGFARGGLPVVLYHNTPNNSVAPLWVYRDPDEKMMAGLFPRIRRHWDVE